ncbi:MAG: aldehyde dehydrogenase family protein [Saprospiraceae bacterium]
MNSILPMISNVFDSQRAYFDEGNTKSYTFRLQALKQLKATIIKHKDEVIQAMYDDYKKPLLEAYIGDIAVVMEELNHTIKHLSHWMEEQHTSTPITIQPAGSKVIYEPKGLILIFAPWNYPFNLAITPLIGAIAAGNCTIVKVAHETPHTARVIAKIIEEAFENHHVFCLQGEGKAMGELLFQHFTFNHVFFTGSATTGKWIMEQAAKTLTPVTLELGGKCPSIVDKTARLDIAVNRIVWSKYFNAGQTCLATDHVLVHESVKDKFIAKVKEKVRAFYGDDPKSSPDFARIVNQTRTEKLVKYLTQGSLEYGGQYDIQQSYISPTAMVVDDLDLPIMKEEIFGPILPIIVWKNPEDILSIVRRNRYPLACYVFSENSSFIEWIHQNIEFGGGCVNNAMVHYGNSNQPFGGVMSSGIGKYHGIYSFQTFSNAKPIVSSTSLAEMHVWYPPYTPIKKKIVELFVG